MRNDFTHYTELPLINENNKTLSKRDRCKNECIQCFLCAFHALSRVSARAAHRQANIATIKTTKMIEKILIF